MNKLELNPIKVSNLHHAEVGQFINRYFEDVAKSNINFAEDPDLEQLHNKLDNQRPTFNLALDQIRAQEETQQIALLDQYRDDDTIALRFAHKAYRKTREPEKLKAYTAINIVLKQYDGVENDNYEQQTIREHNMINQLTDSNHMQHIALLKLEDFVKNLNESNAAFNNLFANRSYEIAIKTVYDTKALRQQLLADYKLLADYVESLANVKQNTNLYKDLLSILNNGRQYFANILARRKATNKDSGEDK